MKLLLRHHLGVLSLGGAVLWALGYYDASSRLTYPTLFYLVLISVLSFYQLFGYLKDRHPSWAGQIDQAAGLGISMRVMIQALGGFESPFYPVLYLAMAFGSAVFSVPVVLGLAGFVVGMEHVHDWAAGTWSAHYPGEVVRQLMTVAFAFLPGFFLHQERKGRQASQIRLRAFEKEAQFFDFLRFTEPGNGRHALEKISKSSRERDLVAILSDGDRPLEELTNYLFEKLKPNTAAVFMVDNTRESVWLRKWKSAGNHLDICHPIPLRDSIFAWPYNQKKNLYIPDVKSPDVLQYYTEPPPVRSLLCSPVTVDEEVAGFIVLDSLEGDAFESQQDALMGLSRAYAAHAVRTLKSMQYIHQEGIVFSTFNQASQRISSSLNPREIAKAVGEVVKGVLECDVVALAIYETVPERIAIYHPIGLKLIQGRSRGHAQEEGEPIVIRPGEGIIGWTIDHKEPFPKFTVDDRMALLGDEVRLEEIRSFTCLPLNLKEQCHGALLVGSYEKNYLDARDLHILRNIVSQTALAVAHSKSYREKEMQSLTDGLTTLYNRRYFLEALEREIDRVERFPEEFTVLLMDLDHFKRVNDTFGHAAGDLVLKKVARQLKSSTRRIDTIARYGGEEFGAILVNTVEKEGARFADRIRREVSQLSFPVAELGVAGKGVVQLSASIGVSAFPHDARSSKELVDRADKALYYAKNTGRDRVSTYSRIKNLLPS
ncbi:MAG: diguanylate cyclase [Nitrospirae bacterium]|nr:diguanylate cyclase [Nitrospirota bacterium]